MIKKLVVLLLALTLALCFTACGGDNVEDEFEVSAEESSVGVFKISVPIEESKSVVAESKTEESSAVESMVEESKTESSVPQVESSKAVAPQTSVEPENSSSKTESTVTSSKTTDTATSSKTASTSSGFNDNIDDRSSAESIGGTTGGSGTPKNGSHKTENGKDYVWIEGFGWVEDGGDNDLIIVK